MRQQTTSRFEIPAPAQHHGTLDLVVPFTTPELTRSAMEAATAMGSGLNAALRLLRIQVVPVQVDLYQSPVAVNFLKEQIAAFMREAPATRELRFARDFKAGLEGSLTPDSVVILAARRRPWKTSNERLAAALRRDGYRVVLVTAPVKSCWTTHEEVAHA